MTEVEYKVMWFETQYGSGFYPIGTCSHIISFTSLPEAVDCAKRIMEGRKSGKGSFRNASSTIHLYRGNYIDGPCEVFDWQHPNEDGTIPSHINERTESTCTPLYW